MGSTMPNLIRRVAAAALVVGLAVLSAVQLAADAAPRPAPAFRLPSLAGGMIGLADFARKPVILLFWAPW